METLSELIEGKAAASDLAASLDGLDPSEGVRAVISLRTRLVRELFTLAQGGRPPGLEDLVPEGEVFEERIFEGRNSMPLFSRFQKRLFRTPEGVFGYNRQGASWLTGPGYFKVEPSPDGRELLFDYTRLPQRGPESGPPVRPNDALLAKPFFGGLKDRVRRVSRDCLIGWAYKDGKDLGVAFVLVRSAPS